MSNDNPNWMGGWVYLLTAMISLIVLMFFVGVILPHPIDLAGEVTPLIFVLYLVFIVPLGSISAFHLREYQRYKGYKYIYVFASLEETLRRVEAGLKADLETDLTITDQKVFISISNGKNDVKVTLRYDNNPLSKVKAHTVLAVGPFIPENIQDIERIQGVLVNAQDGITVW